jgi:hypothetical protein
MNEITDSYINSTTDETLKLRLLEQRYVQNHFKRYIKRHSPTSRTSPVGTRFPDYKANIATQVMINTDGLFTLPQLHVLCRITIHHCIDWSSWGIYYSMHNSIILIVEHYLDDEELGDIKSFLRTITSLNPIAFNALIYLMHDSKLFIYDSEKSELSYPDVKTAKSK